MAIPDQSPIDLSGIEFLDKALMAQMPADEVELETRLRLAGDMKQVFEAQIAFTSGHELMEADSRRNLEAIAAIAERFFQSQEMVTPDWPDPTGNFWRTYLDAVTLEVIRRTVLVPPDVLISISHEVIYVPNIGSFDEDKYLEDRKKRWKAVDPKQRSVEEWEAILRFEDKAILDYIQAALNFEVQRTLAPITLKRNSGQDLTEVETARVIAMQKFVPVLWAENIADAFEGIKLVLGNKANFRDFLQMLERFEASLDPDAA